MSLCENSLEGYLTTAKQGVEFSGEVIQQIKSEEDKLSRNLSEKQLLEEFLTISECIEDLNDHAEQMQQITQKTLEITANMDKLTNLQRIFLDKSKWNLENVSSAMTILHEKMKFWRYQQQQEANGFVYSEKYSLEQFQGDFEHVAYLLWTSRQQLKNVECLQQSSNNGDLQGMSAEVTFLQDEVTRLLTTVFNEAFVVEQPPPQIIKRGTTIKPGMNVSLLLTNLGQKSTPEVSVRLIDESQVRSLNTTETIRIKKDDEMLNSVGALQTSKTNPAKVVAEFTKLHLKKRLNSKKDPTSSTKVSECKCAFLFESFVDLGENLKIRIRTLSYSVVVSTHTTQMDSAMAAIMWDHRFGEMGRIPFKVPSKVPWSQLGELISLRFQIHTGRQLSSEQLLCLKRKLTGSGEGDPMVSYDKFAKDKMSLRNDKPCEFWAWLYHVMCMIVGKGNSLKELWTEGLISGFVDSTTAENLLRGHPPGTFLLRFSESVREGIAFVRVDEHGKPVSGGPLCPEAMKTVSLADFVKYNPGFQYLYPNGCHKNDAFGKHYSSSTSNNYPEHIILINVPTSCSEEKRAEGAGNGSSRGSDTPPEDCVMPHEDFQDFDFPMEEIDPALQVPPSPFTQCINLLF